MILPMNIDLTFTGDFLERPVDPNLDASPLFWVPRGNRYVAESKIRDLKNPFFGLETFRSIVDMTPAERVFFPRSEKYIESMTGCARCGGDMRLPLVMFHCDEPFQYFICNSCEEQMNEEFIYPYFLK